MQMLMNTKELKLIYTWDNEPVSSHGYAHNLGYKLGASSWNNDLFTPYLNQLINNSIVKKVYDFVEGDTREGLYEFSDGTQIEFIGTNHMNYKLYYLY